MAQVRQAMGQDDPSQIAPTCADLLVPRGLVDQHHDRLTNLLHASSLDPADLDQLPCGFTCSTVYLEPQLPTK